MLSKYTVGVYTIDGLHWFTASRNIHYAIIYKRCRVVHQQSVSVINILVRSEVDNAVILHFCGTCRQNRGMCTDPCVFHIKTGTPVNNTVVIHDAVPCRNDIIAPRCTSSGP